MGRRSGKNNKKFTLPNLEWLKSSVVLTEMKWPFPMDHLPLVGRIENGKDYIKGSKEEKEMIERLERCASLAEVAHYGDILVIRFFHPYGFYRLFFNEGEVIRKHFADPRFPENVGFNLDIENRYSEYLWIGGCPVVDGEEQSDQFKKVVIKRLDQLAEKFPSSEENLKFTFEVDIDLKRREMIVSLATVSEVHIAAFVLSREKVKLVRNLIGVANAGKIVWEEKPWWLMLRSAPQEYFTQWNARNEDKTMPLTEKEIQQIEWTDRYVKDKLPSNIRRQPSKRGYVEIKIESEEEDEVIEEQVELSKSGRPIRKIPVKQAPVIREKVKKEPKDQSHIYGTTRASYFKKVKHEQLDDSYRDEFGKKWHGSSTSKNLAKTKVKEEPLDYDEYGNSSDPSVHHAEATISSRPKRHRFSPSGRPRPPSSCPRPPPSRPRPPSSRPRPPPSRPLPPSSLTLPPSSRARHPSPVKLIIDVVGDNPPVEVEPKEVEPNSIEFQEPRNQSASGSKGRRVLKPNPKALNADGVAAKMKARFKKQPDLRRLVLMKSLDLANMPTDDVVSEELETSDDGNPDAAAVRADSTAAEADPVDTLAEELAKLVAEQKAERKKEKERRRNERVPLVNSSVESAMMEEMANKRKSGRNRRMKQVPYCFATNHEDFEVEASMARWYKTTRGTSRNLKTEMILTNFDLHAIEVRLWNLGYRKGQKAKKTSKEMTLYNIRGIPWQTPKVFNYLGKRKDSNGWLEFYHAPNKMEIERNIAPPPPDYDFVNDNWDDEDDIELYYFRNLATECNTICAEICDAEEGCQPETCPCFKRSAMQKNGRIEEGINGSATVYECCDFCPCRSNRERCPTIVKYRETPLQSIYISPMGYTLRTMANVQRGEPIISFTGARQTSVTPEDETWACTVVNTEDPSWRAFTGLFDEEVDFVVNPREIGNGGRFVCHSYFPNCAFIYIYRAGMITTDPDILIYALEPLEAGDMLYINYGSDFGILKSDCRCTQELCHHDEITDWLGKRSYDEAFSLIMHREKLKRARMIQREQEAFRNSRLPRPELLEFIYKKNPNDDFLADV